MERDLIRKARLLVYEGFAPSLVGLIERGLDAAIRRLELHRGHRMKPRQVRLRAGRKSGRT
jgi:hypothetical protein